MRERLALYASASTLVMAVMMSPCVWAQQDTRREGNEQKSETHRGEKIHGVIAGITAEGEVFYNYQTNAAVKAETAFLTVIGSPMRDTGNRDLRSGADARERGAGTGERGARSATLGGNERRAEGGGHRHNVYIVWLTPKTKICKATHGAGTAEHARTAERENASGAPAHANKECQFDELEVGDHVEIAFNREEESAAHSNIHQSQQMRQRHGRHRTHIGYATAITILPPRERGQSSSEHKTGSKEGSN